MSIRSFLSKQFIDVIQWTEPKMAFWLTATPCRTWRSRTAAS